MNFLLMALLTVSQFVAGDDVWITLPDESVIACYHDDGFTFVGVYQAVMGDNDIVLSCPGGGCDFAIAWDKDDVWVQFAPKYIGFRDDGTACWAQDPQVFILWNR